MTDNEMRIVIAEQCGFVWYRHPSANSLQNAHYRFLANPAIHEFEQSPQWMVRADMTEKPCAMDYMAREFYIPDYPNDLNAIAEAVKTLETGFDGSQADDYQQTLWSIVNPGIQWEQPLDEPQPLYDVGYLQNMIEATARQRCEAFIKTVCPEKWKGNE